MLTRMMRHAKECRRCAMAATRGGDAARSVTARLRYMRRYAPRRAAPRAFKR